MKKKKKKKPSFSKTFSQEKTVSDVFMVGTFPAKIFYNNFLNETESGPSEKRGNVSVTWKTEWLSSVFQKKKKKKLKGSEECLFSFASQDVQLVW